MTDVIQQEVQKCVYSILGIVREQMAAATSYNGGAAANGKAKVAKKAKIVAKTVEGDATPKVAKASKTAGKPRDMQCRFETKAGVRCEDRSRGPRFHFLCAKHGDKS